MQMGQDESYSFKIVAKRISLAAKVSAPDKVWLALLTTHHASAPNGLDKSEIDDADLRRVIFPAAGTCPTDVLRIEIVMHETETV
eukprot:scaffold280832_cov35-Tisochrysis_lutea.AAC.2